MNISNLQSGTKVVAMVVYPDCQHLDVAGPLEVFARTSRWLLDRGARHTPAYEVLLTAASAGRVRLSSGLELHVTRPFHALGEVDTLLVAGGIGCRDALEDEALLGWIRERAASTRRVGSICSGALLLARAGLLRGREATTHWAYCDRLAAIEPTCQVRRNAIYVESEGVFTSAGVTTGIDLALALVEEDYSKAVAVAVAQELIVYRRRPGGQDQFSRFLEAEKRDDRFGALQLWIIDNLDKALSVEQLAEAAGMSVRHFTRRFRAAIGMSPADYVARLRIEEARRQLESGTASLKVIAARCGFGSEQNLRRAFQKMVGVSPAEYRSRFGS